MTKVPAPFLFHPDRVSERLTAFPALATQLRPPTEGAESVAFAGWRTSGRQICKVLALVARCLDGVVPAPAAPLPALDRNVDAALERFELHDALSAIWHIVEDANRSIVETKPWALARAGDPRVSDVLGDLCAAIRLVGGELEPFLPSTSREILRRVPPPGSVVVEGPPLFPKD